MTPLPDIRDAVPPDDEQPENVCPECGCDGLNYEVLDDLLYQISGGRDSREILVTCSCCDYREVQRG